MNKINFSRPIKYKYGWYVVYFSEFTGILYLRKDLTIKPSAYSNSIDESNNGYFDSKKQANKAIKAIIKLHQEPISKQPMQPVYEDDFGTVRFKGNSIVEHLMQNGNIDMNGIDSLNFPKEDREQFAQLIGYSLSGYRDLSYTSKESYKEAKHIYKSTKS